MAQAKIRQRGVQENKAEWEKSDNILSCTTDKFEIAQTSLAPNNNNEIAQTSLAPNNNNNERRRRRKKNKSAPPRFIVR